MFDRTIVPMLGDARRLHVTASGDPFGSAHFRYVLKSLSQSKYPKLRLDLQTNGVLFDSAAWEELSLSDRVDRVAVSLDAARSQTYSIVRRGGDFDRLMNNLKFLAKQRRAGQIKTLRLDFVVQALNFREMPEFADLAAELEADGVKFQMIRNWNTYTAVDFAEQNVGAVDHSLHSEFLTVLQDPRLGAVGVELWGLPASANDSDQKSTEK